MKVRLWLGAALVFTVTLSGSAKWAVADDLLPPPWRGQPLTTLAEWEFLTPANPAAPDGTLPTVMGDGGAGLPPLASMSGPLLWDPFDGDGAWIGEAGPLPGQIELDIPNWIDNEPIKWLQIQMTVQRYFVPDPLDPTKQILVSPHVNSISAFDPAGPTNSMLVQVLPELPVNPLNGTYLRTEVWKILPNPDNEQILIDVPVDTLVDEIVVDTISIPEPTTCGLLAVVLLGLSVVQRRLR